MEVKHSRGERTPCDPFASAPSKDFDHFRGEEDQKFGFFIYFLSPVSPDLVVVELLHRCFGLLFVAEGDKGISPVVPAEVHHHPHLVDFTELKTGRATVKHRQEAQRDLLSSLAPSHTAAPVRPRTDLSAVSPQRSRSPSLVEGRSSRVEGRRSAAGRSPKTKQEALV